MKEEVSDENASRDPIRVVLIAGDEIVHTGIQAVLAEHSDRVRLVGHVSSEGVGVDAVTDLRPDVALVVSGGGQGDVPLALVGELESKHSVRVLVLSGARLAEALVQASRGASVLDPELATGVTLSAAHAGLDGSWRGSQLGLSSREADVLRLLADGLNNRDIAAELDLGVETVKTHLRSIYKKLGVTGRTQAVALTMREGLFSADR